MKMALALISVFFAATAVSGQETFEQFCEESLAVRGACPPICRQECLDLSDRADCPARCLPKPCETFGASHCPTQFCRVLETCSKDKICRPKIDPALIPACGDITYNGQDVECCPGLVKRCGFDYLDGSCNMDGKNSPYELPLCIACGDGRCTNFENHCNCPQDCPKAIIPLDTN